MTPVLGLRVHGWVPVRVVKHDRVGSRQVDPQPTRPGGEDKGKDPLVLVELVHQPLPLLDPGRPVQAGVRVLVVVQKLFQRVQHLGHLRENQHPVPSLLQLVQEPGQRLQLSAVVLDQPPVRKVQRLPDPDDVAWVGDLGRRRQRTRQDPLPLPDVAHRNRRVVKVRVPRDRRHRARNHKHKLLQHRPQPLRPLDHRGHGTPRERRVVQRRLAKRAGHVQRLQVPRPRERHGSPRPPVHQGNKEGRAEPRVPLVQQLGPRQRVLVRPHGVRVQRPRHGRLAPRPAARTPAGRRRALYQAGKRRELGRQGSQGSHGHPVQWAPRETHQVQTNHGQVDVGPRDSGGGNEVAHVWRHNGGGHAGDREDVGVQPRENDGRENGALLMEVRVVAHLPELHEDVHHRHVVARGERLARLGARHKLLVEEPLALGERAHDDVLVLGRELRRHVLLQPPEEERAEHRVEPPDNPGVDRRRPLDHGAQRSREPVLKLRVRLEHVRHEKVHQRPQLHHRVLQRRPRQEQAPPRLERQQRLPPQRLEVLDVVRLVQNQVLPLLPPERLGVLQHNVVRRDANVERVVLGPPAPLCLPLLDRPVVRQDLEPGDKLFRLLLPVENDRRRDHNQVRAPHPAVRQDRKERQRLDRLSQPHLVRQNPVQLFLVQRRHPLHTNLLVPAERPAEERGGLPPRRQRHGRLARRRKLGRSLRDKRHPVLVRQLGNPRVVQVGHRRLGKERRKRVLCVLRLVLRADLGQRRREPVGVVLLVQVAPGPRTVGLNQLFQRDGRVCRQLGHNVGLLCQRLLLVLRQVLLVVIGGALLELDVHVFAGWNLRPGSRARTSRQVFRQGRRKRFRLPHNGFQVLRLGLLLPDLLDLVCLELGQLGDRAPKLGHLARDPRGQSLGSHLFRLFRLDGSHLLALPVRVHAARHLLGQVDLPLALLTKVLVEPGRLPEHEVPRRLVPRRLGELGELARLPQAGCLQLAHPVEHCSPLVRLGQRLWVQRLGRSRKLGQRRVDRRKRAWALQLDLQPSHHNLGVHPRDLCHRPWRSLHPFPCSLSFLLPSPSIGAALLLSPPRLFRVLAVFAGRAPRRPAPCPALCSRALPLPLARARLSSSSLGCCLGCCQLCQVCLVQLDGQRVLSAVLGHVSPRLQIQQLLHLGLPCVLHKLQQLFRHLDRTPSHLFLRRRRTLTLPLPTSLSRSRRRRCCRRTGKGPIILFYFVVGGRN